MKNKVTVTKEQLDKSKHFRFCIIDKNKILLETYHVWWKD